MVLDIFEKIVFFANSLTIHYLAIPRKGENWSVKPDFKKCACQTCQKYMFCLKPDQKADRKFYC